MFMKKLNKCLWNKGCLLHSPIVKCNVKIFSIKIYANPYHCKKRG